MQTNFLNQTLQAGAAVAAGLACMLPVPCVAELQAQGSARQVQAPSQGAWPKTTIQQGRYFSFAAPTGWQVNESTNGVDITNPDLIEGVNFVGLEGTPGMSSPKQQIEKIGQALGLRYLKITGTRIRPSQHGFDTAEFLFSFTDPNGRSCEGWAWSAVNNSFGRNNAYNEIAWATADVWPRDAQFLVAAARLVSVTDPQQAFQRDQLVRLNVPVGPGSAGGFNHPNTFTPYNNQAAMDRISERNARARRDDYPLEDPSTGRTYHGTSSNYDYVRGGWVNPQDPTQLLQVVPP